MEITSHIVTTPPRDAASVVLLRDGTAGLEVFLMRRGGAAGSSDTYTLRLAEDVYPNQPNVRRYTVELDARLFTEPHFRVTTIGPFVLATRNRP